MRIASVALAACLLLAGCGGESPRSDLPVCDFEVGDSVHRGDIGAVVPPPGESVDGHGDYPYGGSQSIRIDTGKDGVVTIVRATNGVEASPERCRLVETSSS